MRKLFVALLTLFGVTTNTVAAPQENATEGTTAALQIELTGLALRIAQEDYGIKLDFSTDSVKKVEFILDDIHKKYKKTGDETGLNGIAIEFAAYLITTIEKNTEKGRWERNHKEVGDNTFPFHWKGSTLFPYGWCLKRIYDGEADNIWSKYKALVLKYGQ